MDKSDLLIIVFESANKWQSWLEKNHTNLTGIWVKLAKKDSGIASITYAQALDEALCYGWIDGQIKAFDEQYWLQKFTPRRPRSIWSKVNIGHVERLIKENRMQPTGLAAVTAAKADGRWSQAYDSPKNMVIPDDFLKELSKSKQAEAFFKTLNKANTYAIAWRLQTAKKPETRARRMQVLLEMMAKGQRLH